MKHRFTVSFIALTNVTLFCHSELDSIRVQLGRRRYLEIKSSKSSQNLFDEDTTMLSSKSMKANDSTEAISSKSSKKQSDHSIANLSTESTKLDGPIEVTAVENAKIVSSKSTKSSKKAPKSSKTLEADSASVGSNLFENVQSGRSKSSKSSLFELGDGDELNPSIISSDEQKETLLTDLSMNMSMSAPYSAPTSNPTAPAAPFTATFVDTVISQVLTPTQTKANSNDEKYEELLFIDEFNGSDKQDFTEDASYATIKGNGNTSLVIGFASVSVVLILATVGLVVSQRKSLIEMKLKASCA